MQEEGNGHGAEGLGHLRDGGAAGVPDADLHGWVEGGDGRNPLGEHRLLLKEN